MDIRAHHARDVGALNRLFSQEVQGSLTERGRREAADVARALGSRRVDALLTSPLVRARETGAVAAAALGLDLEVREELVELRTGGLRAGSPSARLIDALAKGPLPERPKRMILSALTVPLYFQGWRRGLTEGGESLEAFEGRVDRVFADLRERHHPDSVVALFAHGYLIMSIATRFAQGTREHARIWRRPYIPNGAITEIELPAAGAPRIVSFAAASHLGRARGPAPAAFSRGT